MQEALNDVDAKSTGEKTRKTSENVNIIKFGLTHINYSCIA